MFYFTVYHNLPSFTKEIFALAYCTFISILLCEFIKKNFIVSASSFKINLTYLELKTWQLLSIKCIHLA